MERKHNEELTLNAKNLRKNPTKEERKLWYDFLKTYPVKIYCQKVLGNYIADFYCAKANLVIELDGSQHYEHEGIVKDEERTAFLEKYKLTVLRVPNKEVNRNFQGVCLYIDNFIKNAIVQNKY